MSVGNRRAYTFLGAYLLLFGVCAIGPYDRAVWWAENIPIMLLVGAVMWMHRYHRFSSTSYLFMSVLVVLHTIGGHYTFERAPFGLVTELFGFERNHYDRLAHFSVGLYAYPIAEVLLKKRLVSSVMILALFPVFAIFTVAGGYEIFEWAYAIYADPGAGIAVLGSQGDIWDAQKDILADALGALFAITVFFYVYRAEVVTINSAAIDTRRK
jgi:putative membrane protein